MKPPSPWMSRVTSSAEQIFGLPERRAPVNVEYSLEVLCDVAVRYPQASLAVLGDREIGPVLGTDQYRVSVHDDHLVVAVHQPIGVDITNVRAKLKVKAFGQDSEILALFVEIASAEDLPENDAYL